MKTTLIASTISALALAASMPVAAEVTAYGRVTYNLISDDTSDDTYFGRHEFAESTIGIKGSKKWGEYKIGANVEIGLNEGVATLLQHSRIVCVWFVWHIKTGHGAIRNLGCFRCRPVRYLVFRSFRNGSAVWSDASRSKWTKSNPIRAVIVDFQ